LPGFPFVHFIRIRLSLSFIFMPNFPTGLPDLLNLLPAVINHLLAREQWAVTQLKPHAGKMLRIEVEPFRLALRVTAEGLVEQARPDPAGSGAGETEESCAARIMLPLSALPLAMQGRRGILPHVKVEGDAEFANTVSFLAENLRWDAEEDLSQWIGDAAAHRVAGTARALAGQLATAGEKLAANFSEYFLEENPQLLRPRTIDAHMQAVRALRDDIARLEKRLEHLAARMPQ